MELKCKWCNAPYTHGFSTLLTLCDKCVELSISKNTGKEMTECMVCNCVDNHRNRWFCNACTAKSYGDFFPVSSTKTVNIDVKITF